MTIAIKPLTLATGTDDPAEQVSKNVWNAGHELTAAPGSIIGTNEDGDAIEIPYVTPEMFGAVGNNVADDSAAFVEALAYLEDQRVENFGYGAGSGILRIPAKPYFMGTTTLDIRHSVRMLGAGCGNTAGGATVLRWAAGATGIRTQAPNTTGAEQVQASTGYGGGNSILEGLLLYGGMAGTEAEAHGIHMRAACAVKNCSIYNFQGNGIHILATAGGGVGSEGNANSFLIERTHVEGNRNGLYADGADANIGMILGLNAKSNRQWGVWDSSFLGNSYFACHTAGNGFDGATNSIPTGCTHSGNRYSVIPGQAAGASTNAPSGTTADNTWWAYHSPGGVAGGIVAWVSGTTFREGGAYYLDNGNARGMLNACYSESDQGFSWAVTPNMVVGGLHGVDVKGDASWIRASLGATEIDAILAATLEMSGIGTIRESLKFYHPTLLNGTISSSDVNRALTLEGTDFISFSTFAAFVANITGNGFDLAAGKDILYNGTALPLRSVTASKLIGRGSGSAGVAEAITLGTNLAMSGTTLNAAGYEAGPPGTAPTVASLTWTNQGTATATNVASGLLFDNDVDGEVHILGATTPATPFDVYMRVEAFQLSSGAITTDVVEDFGIVLRDNTNGDFVYCHLRNRRIGTGDEQNVYQAMIERWTNPTTFSAVVLDRYMVRPINWLRVNVTGTTITLYVSVNGRDWIQVGTETIATFVGTVDRYGIGLRSSGTTISTVLASYFSTTAPI